MGTVGWGLLGPWDPGAEIRPRPGSAGLIWCSLTTLGLPWAPCLSRYLPDRPSAPGTFPAHPAWPAPRPPWSPGPPTTCHDSPSAVAARPVGDCAWLVGAPHLPTEVPGVRDPRPPLPWPQVVSQDQGWGGCLGPTPLLYLFWGEGAGGATEGSTHGEDGPWLLSVIVGDSCPAASPKSPCALKAEDQDPGEPKLTVDVHVPSWDGDELGLWGSGPPTLDPAG